jgi:hypothetical protein
MQAAATGTTIAFHEEHLPDEQTRTVRKDHWAQVLDDLESAASSDRPHQSSRAARVAAQRPDDR